MADPVRSPQTVRVSLAARVALLGSLFVLVATLAVGGNLLLEARAVMHARAADSLDSSMRLLRAGMEHAAGEKPDLDAAVDRVESVTGGTTTVFIREISDVANGIAAAVEEQEAAMQEIVRNVAQAASGIGAVTTNIAGVARASEETGAAAAQVLSSASELSRQSEHLSAEVARFLGTMRAA